MLKEGQYYKLSRKDGEPIVHPKRPIVVLVESIQNTHVVISYGVDRQNRISLFRDNYIFEPLSSLEKEIL